MREPSDQGAIRAFTRYENMLLEMGVNPVNHVEKNDGDPTNLEHLLWMCQVCKKNVRDDGKGFTIDKYSRWLGYIQGVLICKGLTTVDEERNQTRQYWS